MDSEIKALQATVLTQQKIIEELSSFEIKMENIIQGYPPGRYHIRGTFQDLILWESISQQITAMPVIGITDDMYYLHDTNHTKIIMVVNFKNNYVDIKCIYMDHKTFKKYMDCVMEINPDYNEILKEFTELCLEKMSVK